MSALLFAVCDLQEKAMLRFIPFLQVVKLIKMVFETPYGRYSNQVLASLRQGSF